MSISKQKTSQLVKLAEEFMEAKTKEEEARRGRIEIEEKIAALVETPEEGQKTVPLGGGVKLTVTRGLIYKADVDGIERLLLGGDSPPPIKVKTTRELDIQGYKWYRITYPDIWKEISKFVEVKPKKVYVSVKGK